MSTEEVKVFHSLDSFSLPVVSVHREPTAMDATLRQYAAIKLRVPDSGTDWLDEMILKSLRDYMAIHANSDDITAQLITMRAKSETGILPDNYVSIARYMHADSMLGARK